MNSNQDNLTENLQILEIIKTFCEKYPDLRFAQVLGYLDVVMRYERGTSIMAWKDEFYTPSKDILNRIIERCRIIDTFHVNKKEP
jgi:predicted Ser/Thr protein kinase